MKEVYTTKGTRDQRKDSPPSALELETSATAHVGKDITLAHLNEGEFGIVAVGGEIWGGQHLMQARDVGR